jgi:plasmid stability protein
MTNLTLTIDENILRQARILALQRGTSVNAMVREFLAQQVASVESTEDRVARFKKLLKAAQFSAPKTDGRPTWPGREALYDEDPRMQKLYAIGRKEGGAAPTNVKRDRKGKSA